MRSVLRVFVSVIFLFFGALCAGEGPAGAADDELCPVCLEPIDPGHLLRLPCGHKGHISCFVRWLRQSPNGTCPLCRVHIDLNQIFASVCGCCNAPLGDDHAALVELGCHHVFHRICAENALFGAVENHVCPVCNTPVEGLYDLSPSARARCLLRHANDFFSFGSAMVVATMLAFNPVGIALSSGESLVDNIRAGLQSSVRLGFWGGIGWGVAFALHDDRHLLTRLYNASREFAQSRDIVNIIRENFNFGVPSMVAYFNLAGAILFEYALIFIRRLLVNRENLARHLYQRFSNRPLDPAISDEIAADLENRSHYRDIIANLEMESQVIAFAGGAALGGIASGTAVSSVRELRKIGVIIISYMRSLFRTLFR